MLLNKRSKLKLDIEFCILILLILFPATISMKKIKWFAYCYFEIDTNRGVVDSLSCGKCIEDVPIAHENNDPDSPFNHRKAIRFRRDNLNSSTNSTTLETTTKQDESIDDAKNHTARLEKKKNALSNSYCSYFKSNFDSSLNQHESIRLSNEREINVIPLLSDLTHDWYNFDLLYLIEKNDVSTNLDNLTYFLRIPQTLKKIELIDFGIESIKYNAFKNFPKLQVIRLRNNNLNTVELSSFLTPSSEEETTNHNDDDDDESEENSENSGENKSSTESGERKKHQKRSRNKESDGKLIELDLSSNKLYNIKLENFVYLKSLRILNLSNNFIRHFDLQFLSIVTPHLQVLDLSNNQLKRLRVIDNRVHFSSPSSLSPLNDNSYISLVTNLILNELVFLNLENNVLDHLDQLYSISFALVDDQRFCNLSNSISSSSTNQQRPILSINVKNNRWKCDCRTFELIDSLRNILLSNSNATDVSCYLNYLFRVNSFIFANLINFNQNNVSCFSKKVSYSWPIWYQDKCSNQTTNDSTISSSSSSKVISKSSSSSNTTRSNIPALISFKLNSVYSFGGGTGGNNRNSLTTPRVSLLKYDITNLFYWISSICLSVVTISCLLLAWYYCWKRYQSQSAAAATMAAQSTLSNSNHHQQSYRREMAMSGALNSQFMTGRRSDMYLLNSRLSRANGGGGASPVSPYLYQISLNRNTRDEIVRGERLQRSNGATTNNPNLYYISLNPNSSFRGVNSAAYINVGYQSSRASGGGGGGINDIDEPPNYYEAILVGSTIAASNATANNNTNTNNNINSNNNNAMNTRTLITNSLNKNQQQQRHGELLNNSNSVDGGSQHSESPSRITTSSSRPEDEDERSVEADDRIVIVTDQDEITTTTTTTRLRDEESPESAAVVANDMDDDASAINDAVVDYLDVSSMIDDVNNNSNNSSISNSNNTSSATFFIDSNLVQNRRGRSTDV